MRITGGIARGHKLKVPKVAGLRPAQDIVRQAIFNILEAQSLVKGARVLDLFAGTGSLGIEALSRGAAWADFVDHKKGACEAIQQNLNHTHFLGKAKVFYRRAEKFIQEASPASYNLIFLSPPYSYGAMIHFLSEVVQLLKPEGIIVFDHAKTIKLPDHFDKLQVADTRTFGSTTVSFIVKA